MNSMHYRGGRLYVDEIPADRLLEEYGSPLYVYSGRALATQVELLKSAFEGITPKICFSVKSCGNLSVLRALRDLGVSFDVVSGGELFRALKAGASAQDIVFAGVGKSLDEIRQALRVGIFMFNAESIEEVERIDALAVEEGVSARVSLRINPDVADVTTPEKTSTGGRQTKFGIPMPDALRLFTRRWQKTDLCGIHFHLGSPISRADVYIAAIDRAEQFMAEVEAAGGNISHLNIGGGYPVQYRAGEPPANDVREIASVICERLRPMHGRGVKILIEPGRVISANSGVLLATVEYLKRGWETRIAILDAGMNCLLRPAFYGAYHAIWPTTVKGAEGSWLEMENHLQAAGVELSATDIVGPICETSDYFDRARAMPAFAQGDHLAIFSTGAYGMAMASHYNARPLPAEVMVSGDTAKLIRRRESYDDLVAAEVPC